MCDTANFMQCTYYTVVFCALAHELPKSEQAACADEAEILLEKFVETGALTEQVENFCLDILLGKIPLFTESGKQVKTPKGGK